MSLFSIAEADRRLALQLLRWPEGDHYAFAEKDRGLLLVSRSQVLGGEVFEVNLVARTVRRVGGSGEYRLPMVDEG